MEEIIIIILQLLFVYPGAFVRWLLFYRKTKTIREVALDDFYKNSFIAILLIGFIVGIIYSVVN